jgi:hypothetical protein
LVEEGDGLDHGLKGNVQRPMALGG